MIACFSLSLTLLVGSILYKTNEMTAKEWEMFVMMVEGTILLFLLIDFVIGFQQDRIYQALPSNENDVL